MEDKVFYKEQTVKALANFGQGTIHRDFIKAYAEVKKAALYAIAETTPAAFPLQVKDALFYAIDRIIRGDFDNQFILSLKQGGAGTSVHMLLNEVAAGIAGQYLLEKDKLPVTIDPIEQVNLYQSTNDTFPTALTVMVYRHLQAIEAKVILLQEKLAHNENIHSEVMLTGRTELQSALPITLGQVFGAWAGAVERDRWRLAKLKERVRTIALGGTAIGTSFSAPREYVFAAEKKLREITGLPLSRSQNLPDEISNADKFLELASGYNLLACNLFKITGDLLLYTSSFIAELKHPELQYGSTIMPAKTNPVILEYVKGLSIDAQGEFQKINLYAQNGQLQLNPFLPFITECFLVLYQSLSGALDALCGKFLDQFTPSPGAIEENLIRSHVLINCLVPVIGYNKIKEIYNRLPEKQPAATGELIAFLSRETGLDKEFLAAYFNPLHLTAFSKYKKK